jgi:hypothetical protein
MHLDSILNLLKNVSNVLDHLLASKQGFFPFKGIAVDNLSNFLNLFFYLLPCLIRDEDVVFNLLLVVLKLVDKKGYLLVPSLQ